MPDNVILAVLIFLAAILYSSVGHAGASGYLAVMALWGFTPEMMKPTALGLNILVASVATIRYQRAGCFRWDLFWPFAIASIPCAWLGGYLKIPALYYKPLVGCVLIYTAFYFFWKATRNSQQELNSPSIITRCLWGGGLGFLSGLTGVGGGIFLSPLMLMLKWAELRHISGIAATFILVNSIAGMGGYLMQSAPQLPPDLPLWGVCAVLGGLIGSELGTRRLQVPMLKRLLAFALLIGGIKMLITL